MNFVIEIKDESAARSWMSDMEDLNIQTQGALEDVSKELTGISDACSGNLVTQLVTAGDNLCKGVVDVVDSTTVLGDLFKEWYDEYYSVTKNVSNMIRSFGGIFDDSIRTF